MAMQKKYRLPAEWEPQSAILLTWPHSHSDGLSDKQQDIQQAEQTFLEIAHHISQQQALLISCYDIAHRNHVEANLRNHQPSIDMDNVHLHIVPSNDIWARDHGPLTVMHEGNPVLLDFTFNGWGKKYQADKDNQITQTLYRQGAFGDITLETIDIVLEGGSIEVDGQNTLLTTRSCLLSEGRNLNLQQQQIEMALKAYFGVEYVLWLTHGNIVGDDTDGHIDTLARFTDANTICYVSCDDEKDEHYGPLKLMRSELEALHNYQARPYKLVPLPLPQAIKVEEEDGSQRRLPASYANFLVINNAVLMPTYNDPADKVAEQRLNECFPDRKIIGIDCRSLIKQNGSLHCVTMQLPLGVVASKKHDR